MKIRCLIIEDELPAQRILLNYIKEIPLLELHGTFTNALDAMHIISENKIDLLFLDINLPKLSGVNFFKSLKNPPKVIFTTAYSQYAVEGFELDALDYLVKPFSFERFMKAVNKTLPLIHEGVPPRESSFMFIKSDKKITRIEIDDILYVESLRDYLKIVCRDRSHMILQSLKKFLTYLPDGKFIQNHKSFLINISAIDQIKGNIVILEDREIPIGRQYKNGLLRAIEDKMMNP